MIKNGCVYLHVEHNEYIVVINNSEGEISYRGNNIRGCQYVDDFFEVFPPVKIENLTDSEYSELVAFGDDVNGFMLQDGIQRM